MTWTQELSKLQVLQKHGTLYIDRGKHPSHQCLCVMPHHLKATRFSAPVVFSIVVKLPANKVCLFLLNPVSADNIPLMFLLAVL